jgi:hypothetical protein
MVGQMLMMLLEIMVSQSIPLLVGGDVDAGERLVESKLLEWLRSGTAHGVATGICCSWSAAVSTVACLLNIVEI